MFTVVWDEHQRQFSSAKDVEDLLDELHRAFLRTTPTLVTVELADSGDSLAIGLGRERSVLNYVSGSKDPPYYTSKGELVGPDDAIAFVFGGEWSEFPITASVPLAVALSAMNYFVKTGRRSDELMWEQD